MKTIRKNQIDAFVQNKIDSFVASMLAHLRNNFQTQLDQLKIKDDSLRDFVVDGIECSEQFGVTIEADIKLFIECQVLLGPKFFDDNDLTWAKQILTNEKYDGCQKMDRIHSHVIHMESKRL